MSTGYYCYVSSQTDTSEAKGIAIFDVEPDEGRLILRKEVELDNPIHMATSHDGRFLYAITDKGVASFEILPGGDLKRLNIGSIRGLRGCNISISPDDRWLFVSGHYDAKITVLEVNTDGSVGRIACGIFHKGLGVTERDFIPHVRCARLTPDGKYLCVSDDGLDHVVIYSFDSQTGSLKHLDILRFKLQSGPGIMEFSRDGRFLYVMEEILCQTPPKDPSLNSCRRSLPLARTTPTASAGSPSSCPLTTASFSARTPATTAWGSSRATAEADSSPS